jgi:CheY-like chemotaxis protein
VTEDRPLRTILVVDDDAGIRLVVKAVTKEYLKAFGVPAEVCEAKSIDEATALVESGRKFCAVVLDLGLDDRGAQYTADALPGLIELWKVPVIILTGNTSYALRVQCLQSGAIDYVLKENLSYCPRVFLERLENACLRRGLPDHPLYARPNTQP